MSRGVGKALASAIKDEGADGSGRGGRNVFLNARRRKIFSILTLMPCIGAGELASVVGVAQNTVEWHLETLMKEGYVTEHRVGRKKTFFPVGLIGHDLAPLFYVVNHPRTRDALFHIIQGPGYSQNELAEKLGESRQTVSKSLKELEGVGLVSRMVEGSNARLYPTRLLPDGAEEFYKHSKDFSGYIIKKIAQEGGKEPVVVKKGLDRMIVEFGPGAGRMTIEIGINPYITCLIS